MANTENLKPVRTKKEARERGTNGGIKSGEARRAKKTMKEMLDYLLAKEITNKAGETATTQEAITVSLIKQALNGNVKAWEVIRDTIGEKPTEKQEITTNQQTIINVSKDEIRQVQNEIRNLADE